MEVDKPADGNTEGDSGLQQTSKSTHTLTPMPDPNPSSEPAMPTPTNKTPKAKTMKVNLAKKSWVIPLEAPNEVHQLCLVKRKVEEEMAKAAK
ncbi:hypothetical protein FRC11_014071 [Ceratobasidium sp. 423]|nr:hypothetical protein FRC11_014071 [Ceratobasidium sp. 423]